MASLRTDDRNHRKKWRARVHTLTGDNFLGYYETKEEAEKVEHNYRKATGISLTRREAGLKAWENYKIRRG